MGMIDATSLIVTKRGKIYGHDLETTYSDWFHSVRKGYRDELDKSFRVDGREHPILTMNQTGSKPVIFLYDVPDPFVTDSDDKLMLRLRFEFGLLGDEEVEVLVRCISDEDTLPNDFWLIQSRENWLLGRGLEQLLKSIALRQNFFYVFANLDQHATLVGGTRIQNGLEISLTVYFSCSERIPYADSISQLRRRLNPILSVLGMAKKFESAAKDSIEVNVNSGREWKSHKGLEVESRPESFQIEPTAILRKTLRSESEKIIALVATKPPSLSERIPWLRGVTPWLVYCSGGTLDSDLRKGFRFHFQRLAILELDNVVLAQVMLAPSMSDQMSNSVHRPDLIRPNASAGQRSEQTFGGRNQGLSISENSLENLRHSYKPSEIRLLLVGESPPPHKGFFYDATTTEGPLSRNTRRSFEDFFRTKYSDRQDFLRQFKSKGCYLFDLFTDRGKTVYKASKREREMAVTTLSGFIHEVNPRMVLSILKRTSKLVEEAIKRDKLVVRYKVLPYPTRNYVTEYCYGLREFLAELHDTRM